MPEKEIEKLQAEKEKVKRQLAQEQHKIQRLENRAACYEKGERHKRVQHIHIKYDGLGFIPLDELIKGNSVTEVTPYPVKTQGFHHFLILLIYDHSAIAELFLFMCHCCILKWYSIPIFQGGRRL